MGGRWNMWWNRKRRWIGRGRGLWWNSERSALRRVIVEERSLRREEVWETRSSSSDLAGGAARSCLVWSLESGVHLRNVTGNHYLEPAVLPLRTAFGSKSVGAVTER